MTRISTNKDQLISPE